MKLRMLYNKFIQWCKLRSVERSTWEGLIWGCGTSLGAFKPHYWHFFIGVSTGIVSIIRIITKDAPRNVVTDSLTAAADAIERKQSNQNVEPK